MMKVILLCSNYEPGGAQKWSIELEKSFKEKGIQAESWYLHRKYKNFTAEAPLIILDKKISSPVDIISSLFLLAKRIRKVSPDAILASLPYGNTLGLIIAKLCGVKIRIASHHSLSNSELNILTKLLDYFCAISGIYTSIVAVSSPTKESFKYYPQKAFDKVQVINNGIEFKPSTKDSIDCRKMFGFDQRQFILGAIGRLVKLKNHLLLVELLPELKDVYLVIVGKGPLEDAILKRSVELGVEDQLKIINKVESEKIPDFLKAINVFVMPSSIEGLSLSLLEAMYAGLPILSSNIPSQKDVLIRESDGLEAGIVLPLDNPDKWIVTINRLKNENNLCESLSNNAIKRSQDFTLEKMTNGYISVFDQYNQ
ncbi:MAG: glycosyltransferase family 4 protein [Cyclobacteriaceae bacterium]|nr:glycosyltransferase family 4 protein [Cyclobacteriaceae bacterium]MCK5699501.1 glycosyltransferase family 4 protein [Cyclobacteriaceae bacterium]